MIEVDGSMLAVRGLEPWKEAKVGIVYRHNVETRRPHGQRDLDKARHAASM